MRTSDLPGLNLADAQTFLDHDLHELWHSLQEYAPVYRNPATDSAPAFWAVTRHEDILGVYRDNTRFTSTRGNVLPTLVQGADSAAGKMLAITDGPRHRAVRSLIAESFTPKALAAVVAKAKARTLRQIADAVEQGDVDFAEIANQMPISIIGDLIGVPERDQDQLSRWSILALARETGEGDALDEVIVRNEILIYFSDLVEQRHRVPADDVISALATGRVDGKPLSEEEIVLNCYSLLLSDQSVRLASVGGALALAEYPAQWQALKDGSVDVASATEEVLRWTTPSMHFGRRAVADAVIGRQEIAANDIVTLWNIAGNMDPRAFAEPTSFSLNRTPNRHLTFGHGPHFCLGAFLGRALVGSVLAALRELVKTIEVNAAPRQLYSNTVLGYVSAPVRLIGG